MKTRMIAILSSVLTISAHSQSCLTDKFTYSELADQLIIHNDQDVKRLSGGNLERLTSGLHDMIVVDLLKQFTTGKNDHDVQAYLQCVQASDESDIWKDETNLPKVFLMSSSHPVYVAAYWIIRGGNGIPSSKPFIETYRKNGSGWSRSSAEIDFERSTIFLKSIQVDQQTNLIIASGFHFGDPETALTVQVFKLYQDQLKTVYKSNPLPRTKVLNIDANTITLEQDISAKVGKSYATQLIQLHFDDMLRK